MLLVTVLIGLLLLPVVAIGSLVCSILAPKAASTDTLSLCASSDKPQTLRESLPRRDHDLRPD